MQRIAFALPIKPDRVDDYRRTHAAVWPELLEENVKAGIRNFTIVLFMNHAIGLLECEDWEAASAYLDKSDVQARWQAEHADILDVDTASGLVPLQMLEELFHQD
ncbi:MAG: L-rhamnose mutarotase [Chloroflexota bacterium]|nr:L-rhamnose mutarotase [Chloroflexota bacterium]MDE2919121.1 L-rhamnose mutarotase [Chloroflexota bacterium]